MAALVVWCYGFALHGPIPSPPTLITAEEQRRDTLEVLQRVDGVRFPNDLQDMQHDSARCISQYTLGTIDGSLQFARQLCYKPTGVNRFLNAKPASTIILYHSQQYCSRGIM